MSGALEMRPRFGLSPTSPQQLAGMREELARQERFLIYAEEGGE